VKAIALLFAKKGSCFFISSTLQRKAKGTTGAKRQGERRAEKKNKKKGGG
jgi:hypothetical protein